MKNVLLSVVFAIGSWQAVAEPSVSDVVVSQRWPWSEKVDVDFVLSGEAADVAVTATWDGLHHDEDPESPGTLLLGTLFAAPLGHNRFTWDPSSSAYANHTLTGFSVTLVPSPIATRDYLVLDLRGGGYSYRSAPPSDGWTDEYKTSKMVFRRIPAGWYQVGMTTDELDRWCGASTTTAYKEEKTLRRSRKQTFSSDYYLAIFQMTVAQYEAVAVGQVGTTLLPKLVTYDELRGTTNVEDGICWPTTGHAVATNSFLGKLRRIASADLMIDLPTEEQWEAAARAGTTTVFPNGGSVDDDDNQLWAIAGRSLWYWGNGGTGLKAVGLREPDNAWGFYDMLGNRLEWTLDIWMTDGYGRPCAPEAGTDPQGATYWKDTSKATKENYISRINEAFGKRVVRSAYPQSSSSTLRYVLPSIRNGRYPQASDCTARLCIQVNLTAQ